MAKSIFELPETIKAPRTDPIYNCHAYLTKVPVAAIEPFIETFSEAGEVVADIFAGSGMTGLAALRVGRNAKLSDISVLGQHIATGYLQNVPPDELQEAGARVLRQARCAIGDMYQTTRISDGQCQEMVRSVWSFTYTCPSCGYAFVYYKHLDESGKVANQCPTCNEAFVKRLWPRSEDLPVSMVVRGECGKLVEQDISQADLERIAKAVNDVRQRKVPSKTIDQTREMYSRSGLGKAGLTKTAMFFSPRNSIALLELWNAINAEKNERIKQKLRFAFTAILPRASKRYQWGPKRPLNAQNQTYYIAPVYYEWNVFELYKRKVNASIKAISYLFGENDLFSKTPSKVSYELASADKLEHLANESIDYVFTDPPFGSNIFYADMNLFHEAWLGKITEHKSEAVVHTTGKKKSGAQERYESLLRNAFEESFRVLKPGKHMSVVFGNSSGKIWGLVQRAMRSAGFKTVPVHVAILDKGQRSVKGLNSGSEGVVTVDLIMTVQKPNVGQSADDGQKLTSGDTDKLIGAAIRELESNDADNPSLVYARILRKAIQSRIILDDLHLGDVLIALRNAGYSIDQSSGKLYKNELSDL